MTMGRVNGYRKVVGAIVLKRNKVLLVHNQTHGPNFWKFPQGGIKNRESEKNAVLRELEEELGTDKFRLLHKSSVSHRYQWPLKIQKEKGFIGQIVSYWYVKFMGKNSDLNLSGDLLDRLLWVSPVKLPSMFELPDLKEKAEEIAKEMLSLNLSHFPTKRNK